MSERLTTAAYLVAYRNELIDGGFPADVADALARDAAHELVSSEGLAVPNA